MSSPAPIIPHASPKPVAPGTITSRAFVGGGVDVFRALTLASALRLWARTRMLPTRGCGIRRMLAMAAEYTGCKYSATPAGAGRAADAVTRWAEDAAITMQQPEGDAR